MQNAEKKLIPMGNRVLVRRLSAEEKTPGGLFVPENAKEKPSRAEIIAVGKGEMSDSQPGVHLPVDSALVVGAIIVLGKYSGTEIKINGEEYIIVSASEILAVEV
jgi:chaperonin GroES